MDNAITRKSELWGHKLRGGSINDKNEGLLSYRCRRSGQSCGRLEEDTLWPKEEWLEQRTKDCCQCEGNHQINFVLYVWLYRTLVQCGFHFYM